MHVCYVTNQGMVRPENEDALRAGSITVTGVSMEVPLLRELPFDLTGGGHAHTEGDEEDRTHLWIAVADGMGGHLGGEIASALVIQGLDDWSRTGASSGTLPSLMGFLTERLRSSAANGAPESMGTTLSALFITKKAFFVIHVGDSRVYSLSPFARLTRDDTRIQELIEQKLVDEMLRNVHPTKNLLTKALIADRPAPLAQIRRMPVPASGAKGPLFLLCTDGLWENFSEDELRKLCEQDMEKAAQDLLGTALDRGARDNVTFILVGA